MYQIFTEKKYQSKNLKKCAYKMCAHIKNAQNKCLKKYKRRLIFFYKELNNIIIDENFFFIYE